MDMENNQTEGTLTEVGLPADDIDIESLFEGSDDGEDTDTGGASSIYEVSGKANGEDFTEKIDWSNPEDVQRVKTAFEKSKGIEKRNAEKNRKMEEQRLEIERLRAESVNRRNQADEAAQRDREATAISSQVMPLEKYIERYGDEELAEHERSRDIRAVRMEHQYEQDKKARQAQKKAQDDNAQLERAKQYYVDQGFTMKEATHACNMATANGATTVDAAMKLQYPTRFNEDGSVKVKVGATKEEHQVSGKNNLGTLTGGRAPKRGSSSGDMAVAKKLCTRHGHTPSTKELEQCSALLSNDSALIRKANSARRRQAKAKG
jgi:hypothetical protein|tara:strand:- start:528 stop:1487 length:960 start_codon:yes stop_codon:yes gene_type:complete